MSEKSIFGQHLFDKHLGKLSVEYQIKLEDPQAKTVRLRKCIPIEMQDKAESELDRILIKLAKSEVIASVTKPTEWVSSMVVVMKKNTDETSYLY